MHTRNAAFKAKYGSVGFKWIIFGIEQVLLPVVRGYLPGTGTQFYYLGRLTRTPHVRPDRRGTTVLYRRSRIW
jgi:hypothetical protein